MIFKRKSKETDAQNPQTIETKKPDTKQEVGQENVQSAPKFNLTMIVNSQNKFEMSCDSKLDGPLLEYMLDFLTHILTDKFDLIMGNFIENQSPDGQAFLELLFERREQNEYKPIIGPTEVFNVVKGDD